MLIHLVHRVRTDTQNEINLKIIGRNIKMTTGTNRCEIEVGMTVCVVQKQDQRSGNFTEGIVKKILTVSAFHPHGIKVMLESGIVGRVKEIKK